MIKWENYNYRMRIFLFYNFLTKEVKEIFQGDCFPIMS